MKPVKRRRGQPPAARSAQLETGPAGAPPAETPLEGEPAAALPAPLARPDALEPRRPPAPPPFVFSPLKPYKGMVRRFLTVHRHVVGLLQGGLVAYVRALPPERKHGLRSGGVRTLAFLLRPLVRRDLVALPFPKQLRRRLELLGPTYIKLGQIMAIREDILPSGITRELQNLFDRLPPIPFEQVRARIEDELDRPLGLLFQHVEAEPLGSASIAQAHRAETLAGERVVIKVMKPGIRDIIESDLRLLQALGVFLQWILPRYQPRQIIEEFSAYTIREVDFTYEADNAEMFAANFRDLPGVKFPKIYRELSSATVLTMEFLEGFKPGSSATAALSAEERDRLVDLGAGSIIRMLYQDGFFHADLHAGNLLILPGERVRVGFIDLGMVGRFEERTKRRMLYYYHALVTGDVEGAAKFLADMATLGPDGDPHGFRRAVADLSRRFYTHASRGDISIAQLILESVGLGGRFRVFFPVEMTLMVKALVTFEGVGRLLDPKLDVAAVSQKHVARIVRHHFDPQLIARELLRSAPEMIDLAVQLPHLLSSGYRFLDDTLNNRQPKNPLVGLRSSILAAACIVGGVIATLQQGPWPLGIVLFVLALILALWKR